MGYNHSYWKRATPAYITQTRSWFLLSKIQESLVDLKTGFIGISIITKKACMKQVINNRINYQPTGFQYISHPEKLLPWSVFATGVDFFQGFFSWWLLPATKQQLAGLPWNNLQVGRFQGSNNPRWSNGPTRCTFHPTRSSLDPTTRWCSASPPCQPPPEWWELDNSRGWMENHHFK